MLGTVLYGARDVRCEEVPEPKILKPTDAIIRLSATCICGSDLWPFRGMNQVASPMNMGHEYCGIVEEVGDAVKSVRPGQFVVGSFCISDNTCPHCRFGFQSSCEQREFMSWGPGAAGARSACRRHAGRYRRSTRRRSDPEPAGDVRRARHWLYAADAARVHPGSTVAVVSDGAVGLMGVLAAKQMDAGRIIAMSRHKTRQDLSARIWRDRYRLRAGRGWRDQDQGTDRKCRRGCCP